MRKSKSTKKKGRLQEKRMHRHVTQEKTHMDIREGRTAWMRRRKKKLADKK